MEGHQVCGGVLLVSLYLTCCVARWRHARHYGQSFRWMGPVDFIDGWDHMRFVHWGWRALVIAWALSGVLLCMT